MDAKKKVERRYLDVCRRAINDFPPGSVIESESPDFLVKSPGGIVGVEITRIFRSAEPGDPPPQSQDTERDLIAERAQTFAGQSMDPVIVDIYFNSRALLTKRDRDNLAKKLVDLVASSMPGLGENRLIENQPPVNSQVSHIDAVHIWRPHPLRSHLWQVGDAGIVNDDFAPSLQHLIADKDGKVDCYREKCDSCWLVVVADWRGPSAFFEISDRMVEHTYASLFDRLYFLEGYSGRVTQLRKT